MQGESCCAFGEDGKGPGAMKGGGDCIIIPGAQDAAGAVQPDKVCGTKNGLPTATADGMADANSKTVCCKWPVVWWQLWKFIVR